MGSPGITCTPPPPFNARRLLATAPVKPSRRSRRSAPQTLPRGFDVGWSGLAYDESRKGNEAVYIFLIVVAFVYLVLVGQYESFILPLAVILSLPVGLFGSFFFLQAMGLANDVYAQIGLVMLVGLLGKNAILIVEFAVQRRHGGRVSQGGGRRRRKTALPADSDDLLRLHRWSPSAWSWPPAPGRSATEPSAPREPAACSSARSSESWSFPAFIIYSASLTAGANSSRTSRINLLARGSNTKPNIAMRFPRQGKGTLTQTVNSFRNDRWLPSPDAPSVHRESCPSHRARFRATPVELPHASALIRSRLAAV